MLLHVSESKQDTLLGPTSEFQPAETDCSFVPSRGHAGLDWQRSICREGANACNAFSCRTKGHFNLASRNQPALHISGILRVNLLHRPIRSAPLVNLRPRRGRKRQQTLAKRTAGAFRHEPPQAPTCATICVRARPIEPQNSECENPLDNCSAFIWRNR